MQKILIAKIESKETPNQWKFPEDWGTPWNDIWHTHTITDGDGDVYLHLSKTAEFAKTDKEILVRKKRNTGKFGKVRYAQIA